MGEEMKPHIATIMLTIMSICILAPSLVWGEVGDTYTDKYALSVLSIIRMAESSGNPNATDGRSHGLYGISPCVVEDFNRWQRDFISEEKLRHIYTVKDLFRPEVNEEIAEWWIVRLSWGIPEKYNRSKAHLISAWNNGLGWLKAHDWQPPRSHKNRIYNKIYKDYWMKEAHSHVSK